MSALLKFDGQQWRIYDWMQVAERSWILFYLFILSRFRDIPRDIIAHQTMSDCIKGVLIYDGFLHIIKRLVKSLAAFPTIELLSD